MAKVSEMEMPAIAITDHGNLYGVPEFHSEAKKYGIKPIIGCEFYVTPDGLSDRSTRTRHHQVLLAKNEVGYRNLIQLSSLSYTEGYYYKPRIDKATLKKFSEGLVATTCCLQGEVLQAILHKSEDEARKIFEKYLDIFGSDYYVEIQDHGIPEQKKCNHVLLKWAAEYNVKVIATNDVHYIQQEDAAAQDVLLCLQTGKDLSDPNRMRFENDQFYLKSVGDMEKALADLDPRVMRSSLVNTLEIVDKCSFEIPMGNLLMPHYPIPESFGTDMDAFLRHLVFEKAPERYPEMPSDVVDRLEHELGIIKKMGYAGYFLIVQDFTTAARSLEVSVGPGRGSAAGSAVAYTLGITNIDPLKYDLLFERFLNPDRISMPDIDIDFDDRGRSKVIDYVVQKYGRENVCQIVTFGTMGARSVIRDVSRVLGVPLQEADRIAKLIPEGVKVSLERAMKEVPEFRKLKSHDDPQIRNLIHYAQVLEGSARHTGVHAAGVIITPGPVSDFVPVSVSKGKTPADDIVTTQYDGKWVEEFGLLKMDFLGLKTLTVLSDAVRLIKENHGVDVVIDDIPLDDSATLELFQRGDTVSVFQFESDGMREWLRKLKPSMFDDLIAMNALYRPGPMDLIPNYVDRKHGREKVSYPHEMLEPILKPTYGIPVYQEQVMQMAQVMGGYSLGQADLLRRAMGKKKQSEMDKHRTIFVEGAREREVSEKVANEVFDMMAKFAGYGFNKSHSAAYSLVAFHTAYLKRHFPAEYMAASMTNEMGDNKKLANVLDDGKRMGLEILSPSISGSQAHFTVEDGNIRFGLGAIKGVGRGAIEAIVDSRSSKPDFTTLFELTEELDLRSVNKKALDSLARAGAMDALEGHRAQLVEAVEIAVRYGQKAQAEKAAGQNSLFGGGSDQENVMKPKLPAVEPWSRSRLLKEERDLIGVYVSGHPLESFASEAKSFSSASFSDTERFDGQTYDFTPGAPKLTHRFCGIITDVQTRTTRSGKPMAFASIEDFSGQGELVCFASVLDRVQQYLKVDEIVLAIGHPEVRGGGLKVIVNDIYPMWKVRENLIKSIVLRIRTDDIDVDRMKRFEKLCDENRGSCKLYFDIDASDLPKPQRVHSRKFVVEPTNELMAGMAQIFGRDNIVLQGE